MLSCVVVRRGTCIVNTSRTQVLKNERVECLFNIRQSVSKDVHLGYALLIHVLNLAASGKKENKSPQHDSTSTMLHCRHGVFRWVVFSPKKVPLRYPFLEISATLSNCMWDYVLYMKGGRDTIRDTSLTNMDWPQPSWECLKMYKYILILIIPNQ